MKRSQMPALHALVVTLAGFGFLHIASAQQDIITTVAGGGPNDIPALSANVNLAWEIAVDTQGNRYIAAGGGSSRVFKISPAGLITVVAGTGVAGYSGDGGPAVDAQLYNPHGVAVDNSNPANVYIDDWANCLIRRVDGTTGIITTIAGIVSTPFKATCKSSGDGGPANQAGIGIGWTIVVNPANHDLYFTEDGYFAGDANNGRVRKIAGGVGTGTITTVAGNDSQCQGTAPDGVDATASNAYLCHPQSVALDTSVNPPNIFVDSWGERTVREILGSNNQMYLVAGTPYQSGFRDNVVATSAVFVDPWQMVVQVSRGTTTITLPDYNNNRIRQFSLTYGGGVPVPGTITTIAGSGAGGLCGEGGPALKACVDGIGLAIDSAGNWIVGDQPNDRIREISKATGDIASIEGWGFTPTSTNALYSDPVGISNVPATGITMYEPSVAYVDQASGKVYFAGWDTFAIYSLNPANGTASTVAGNGFAGFAGDGGAANSATAEVGFAYGVVTDSSGNLYIPDYDNCVVREVAASGGDITTIAGGSAGHLNGCGYKDNVSAVSATLNGPAGLAFDAHDNLYIADYKNCVIRRITSSGTINTVAGNGLCRYSGDGVPATSTSLNAPRSVALDALGDLFISDTNNNRVRRVDGASGIITTVAGTGAATYTGEGIATANALNLPAGVAVDANGNLFLADQVNNILRWVDPAGQMVTFAGSPPGSPQGTNGFAGDGGLATQALMSNPQSISLNGSGDTYFVDYGSDRIRKVTAFAGYGRSTASLMFGSQATGTVSASQIVTLSAIGEVTIGSIGVPAGFKETDNCDGAKLTAGQTCEINVSFAPTQGGPAQGTLSIASDAFFAGQGNTVELSGNGTGESQVATPVFNPAAGTYTTTQSVTITDATSGATIYYTTNGTTPTTSSTKYTGKITVSSTETIEAIAVASDYTNSAVASATYTISYSGTGPTALQFIPVTPCRVADTRWPAGPFGGPELAANTSRAFDIPQSACGIPSTAVAYSVNVTVVPSGFLNYLTLWPTGETQPLVSTLNSDGRVKANAAITPAGTNGGVSVFVSDETQVILDIDGYFVPAGTTSALAFYPLTPCRVTDTRQATGPLGGPSISGGSSRSFPVQSSSCGIPATAKAYSLNVTAVPHKTLNYLTIWPTGEAQPNVSTLNAPTGTVVANAAIVPAGTSGAISIFVSDDSDVILDVNGYFAPPTTSGLSLYPVTPCRVIDTRSGAGAFNGVLAVDVETSSCAPPSAAQGYVLNATVVPPGPLDYLTLWPAGEAQPYVSTLNALDGAITSNMAIVPTTNGSIDAFASNPTNLILDLSGYFAP